MEKEKNKKKKQKNKKTKTKQNKIATGYSWIEPKPHKKKWILWKGSYFRVAWNLFCEQEFAYPAPPLLDDAVF